ncbi:unnamed protein product [Somion occarium]|uniref:Non-structural maintenance of chromosomes element 4 n=1 Tax=Somion occarium TaxID=3059160 RepID=A0ABP1D5Q2_9APHY
MIPTRIRRSSEWSDKDTVISHLIYIELGKDTPVDNLVQTVQKADVLFERVKGTAEATLDSTVLLQASSLGVQRARAMKSGSGAFDIDDFITKLVIFMGGRKTVDLADNDGDSYNDDAEDDGAPLDWEKVGRKVLAKSHRVPVMDFMLGPLSIEQKKRNTVKRAKLEKNKADEKKPQEITEDDITRSENETTKNVIVLEKLLEEILNESNPDEDDAGKINLFKFIVNPNDFGQSVENLFYLSFLIRDGKVAMETNEKGEPVIFITEQPTQEDYKEGLKKRQIVMEFDMTTWKRAIEVFNITESAIPQRPKQQTGIKGKWYG